MTRSLTFAAGLAVVGVSLPEPRGGWNRSGRGAWRTGGTLACGTVPPLRTGGGGLPLADGPPESRSVAGLPRHRPSPGPRPGVATAPCPCRRGNDLALLGLVASTVPDRTAAMGSVLIDRLIGVTGLFTVAALMGTLNRLSSRSRTCCSAGSTCWRSRLPRACRSCSGSFSSRPSDAAIRLVPTERAKRIALELSRGLQGLAARPSVFLTAMGLSLVTHLLAISAFFSACRACGLSRGEGGWLQLFVVVPFILITTVLPVPVGAHGGHAECRRPTVSPDGDRGGPAFLSYNAIVIRPSTWLFRSCCDGPADGRHHGSHGFEPRPCRHDVHCSTPTSHGRRGSRRPSGPCSRAGDAGRASARLSCLCGSKPIGLELPHDQAPRFRSFARDCRCQDMCRISASWKTRIRPSLIPSVARRHGHAEAPAAQVQTRPDPHSGSSGWSPRSSRPRNARPPVDGHFRDDVRKEHLVAEHRSRSL